MSRKDHQQRKERELKKKEARKVLEELARRREASRRAMPDILGQLNVLFEKNTARAITMAFEEKVPPEEISAALDVPSGHIEYLFDIAGTVSEDLLRIVRRWPQAFENREVLDAALSSLRSGGYRRLFRL
jgi:hypothetical protein